MGLLPICDYSGSSLFKECLSRFVRSTRDRYGLNFSNRLPDCVDESALQRSQPEPRKIWLPAGGCLLSLAIYGFAFLSVNCLERRERTQ